MHRILVTGGWRPMFEIVCTGEVTSDAVDFRIVEVQPESSIVAVSSMVVVGSLIIVFSLIESLTAGSEEPCIRRYGRWCDRGSIFFLPRRQPTKPRSFLNFLFRFATTGCRISDTGIFV